MMMQTEIEEVRAICPACEGVMLDVEGCDPLPVTVAGVAKERVRYGDEPGMRDRLAAAGLELLERCRDCGATVGSYHHPRCCIERCPACGEQAAWCGCSED